MKVFAGCLVFIALCPQLGAQEPDAAKYLRALAANSSAQDAELHVPVGLSAATYEDKTPTSAQQPKIKPARKAVQSKQLKRTKIGASMVGYIESSSVQSQVRVRIDAGFDNPRPDRAEYFYAGTAVPPTGPVQQSLNFQEVYFLGEYAPRQRFSCFAMVPIRWIQPILVPDSAPAGIPASPQAGGGVSDVQAGLRLAALASVSRRVTFQVGISFPTGDGDNGLGTGHSGIEPKVLAFQKLSDRFAIEAEAGDSHPFGGTKFAGTQASSPPQNFAADVAMYGLGPSYEMIRRKEYSLAPVLEIVSWHVFGGLQTGANNIVQSAAGINVLNAKLGARASFSNGSSIYAGYGRGLTSDIWYRNLFRVEYRRSF